MYTAGAASAEAMVHRILCSAIPARKELGCCRCNKDAEGQLGVVSSTDMIAYQQMLKLSRQLLTVSMKPMQACHVQATLHQVGRHSRRGQDWEDCPS